MRWCYRQESAPLTPHPGASSAGAPEPTCGEVDVGEEDDVGGDERDELGDADLLLEVHVDHVLLPQAAVGAGVQQLQAGAEAAQEPGEEQHVTHPFPKSSPLFLRDRSRRKLHGFTRTSKAWLSPGLAPKPAPRWPKPPRP